MTGVDKRTEGTLFLEERKFSRYLERVARKSNDTSCRITVPSELADQLVIVLVPKKPVIVRKRK